MGSSKRKKKKETIKCMILCSTSLEEKTITVLRFHFVPIRMAKINHILT